MRDGDAYDCALTLVRRTDGCPIAYAASREAAGRADGNFVVAAGWAKIGLAVRLLVPVEPTVHVAYCGPWTRGPRIEPTRDMRDMSSHGTTDRLRQRSLAGQPGAAQRGPQAVAG